MENEILKMASTQEKRDTRQEEREKNYQEIISKLTEKFNIVDDINKNVNEIEDYVFKNNK
ncbi:BhlA/UviB family holin-like peptide [Clostridium sp. JS66]|uniref:BhlA/UviB family holin-like peptide n=1 Tax=Clostridium sp. JS66 TaxID=3064705 RepID=UPI00298D6CD1|nr:BhlA/UviB family holin-like peptide [Clostridium sp. JS66]WPC42332.1 BhlA/UviB family holin-like peptide [Clostridium sp. JS66]